MTSTMPDYFVVLVSYKSGREANVDPNMLWSDVLDLVHEVASDGNGIEFIHHVHDGVVEVRTQEAFDATLNFLADYGEPITWQQRDWIESTFGMDVARHFRSAA